MGIKDQIKFLQCNLDRSKSSLIEFTHSFMASNYSFALVSEPYTGSGNEVKPIQGLNIHQFPGTGRVKACIISKPNSPLMLGLAQFSTSNLCVAQIKTGAERLYIVSAYVEPSADDFDTLERLDHFLKRMNGKCCMVGGDFNGWHPLWGSERTNERGTAVVELAYGNDMYFCNTGDTPTFETVTHGRGRTSIIDLTIASSDIVDRITDWTVNLDACVSSQHNAIEFTYKLGRNNNITDRQTTNTSTFIYKNDKASWSTFKSSLHTHMTSSDILDQNIPDSTAEQLERLIDQITDTIHKACLESMPVKGSQASFKPPWWTDALETRKKEVIDLHRQLHAVKRQGLPTDSLAEAHTAKKTIYADELKTASTLSFREFCELQTKENVWSLTNRLIRETAPRRPPTTIKINDRFTTDTHETATALLNHFYPDDTPDTLDRHHELRQHMNDMPDNPDDPPFAIDEILEILKFMNPKKAPGLDNFTSDICYQFASSYPTLMIEILNRCLTLHHFPRQWKRAFIKIIPKPNKHDSSALNSYRPIGLISVFGKLLEKLFIKRVTYAAEKAQKLNNQQFGFREQRNTTMAIHTALNIVKQAKAQGKITLAVSLDIKAAFDNAWWPALMARLREINCPNNIYALIQNYLNGREVILNHTNARVTKHTSKGCIQGSTCGPILWNLVLDELLGMELPPGCHIQAFADDVLLITQARDRDDLQEITNSALKVITQWGKNVKLEFGAAKTQAIAFSPKAKTTNIQMDGQSVKFSRDIKLLGVVIDEKLSFNNHINHIINKATRIFSKLCLYCRPTWGAHPENVKAIYKHVIEPIITYAAGIWGHVADRKCIKNRLLSMQRGFAIKAIKSFRTVSTSAAIALAHFTPLDLKVREVHYIETTRLTGITHLLPQDITLERNTPPHELLHPAHRLTLTHKSFCNEDDIQKHYATHKQDTIHIYTDGSKQEDSSVGAAFVCYTGNREITRKKFRLHNSCSVFQAELFAIYRACLWTRTHPHTDTHTTIFSDSMAALLAIQYRSNTHPLVSAIHHTIHDHPSTIDLAWVRSHVGIPGNEAADVAAKQATTLHRAADYASFPISFVKHRIRTRNRQIWQSRYESASQGQHTRTLLPKLDDIKKLWTLTKTSFYLTQTLTGHGYHKDYLHRFKITTDKTCPCDDSSTQSLNHLFEHCPRFARERNEHTELCKYLDIPPFELTKLFKKQKAVDSYVELTNSILSRVKVFNNT